MLWTTRCLDSAVDQLRARPAEVREDDVLDTGTARFCPLEHANPDCLGRHGFRAAAPAGGGLRPLRDPAASEQDEDE